MTCQVDGTMSGPQRWCRETLHILPLWYVVLGERLLKKQQKMTSETEDLSCCWHVESFACQANDLKVMKAGSMNVFDAWFKTAMNASGHASAWSRDGRVIVWSPPFRLESLQKEDIEGLCGFCGNSKLSFQTWRQAMRSSSIMLEILLGTWRVCVCVYVVNSSCN